MEKKFTSLIGISKREFDDFISNETIQLRPARLIPMLKLGDEMALTSVILSSVRMIKEFRNMILSDLKMMKGGQIFVYTEIIFPLLDDSRIDGLAIIVKGGIIKDAAIFEMKNEAKELDPKQILKYIEIARKYEIPRLVTVSNQFVSEPTQFPLQIKSSKNISLFHFSWSYLLTLANILLFEKNINIEDKDQVEIMKEVVSYLEDGRSGICGFNQMKPGWKEIIEKINSGTRIKFNDPDLNETVSSWQQEEKDMALILSKKLGAFVNSVNSKYKGNLKAREEDDKRKLIDSMKLSSIFKIKGAVSDIKVSALFRKRTIEMSISLKAPEDKTLRGQVGWMKKQIDTCNKKSSDTFEIVKNEIMIEVTIKNSSRIERFHLEKIEDIIEELKNKELREFKIVYIKDFGKSFSNRKKFVEIIEKMIIDYYGGIVQYLKKWEKPAPKIIENKSDKEEIVANENEEDQ
ncbi:MAG: hypothetical protein GPJ50_15545 [Candidatus Heimdallarchaeota archaeon]|nr:hypothetical protein [Candidatus Heimdallarchaeota archaeon]